MGEGHKRGGTLTALSRLAVFTEPGALMYAGNCADLYQASFDGKVTLNASTRRKYPDKPLGEALPLGRLLF